ncbi:MAG: NADH-quinone oxidoreductase subunit N [Solirubrobacterales bacterium]
MSALAAAVPAAPTFDWAALSPLLALLGGAVVVLGVGLAGSEFIRSMVVPWLAMLAFAIAIGCLAWQWNTTSLLIEGALIMDPMTAALGVLVCATGLVASLLAWRDRAARELAHGEFFALLLTVAAGMFVLISARNLVVTFVGLELLSLPLYILCASRIRREHSLEAGLKYLIVGSVGSATLLYGFALVYGATGQTGYREIAAALSATDLVSDPLLLAGLALAVVGFAFKASLAPFHQWTPDVYEGAPTPVTAFMSVATKAAAFAALIRFFDVAVPSALDFWRPAWIAIAVISIVVGNVGAIGQRSMKRMLAYSSIAQAGYLLIGFVVYTDLGIEAVVYYLFVYALANLAAFAVVIARERETSLGDSIDALRGLGARSPALGAAMTFAMLSLAGIPATAGFVGKFTLLESAADGYAWLAVVLVLGSVVSLAYYLPVVSAIWFDEAESPEPGPDAASGVPALAGGSPEADAGPPTVGAGEASFVAVVLGVAIIFFGIITGPLYDLVGAVARGLGLG